ncbi:hypothetical protein RFI_17716, partial [Reticulomyxa filosa]
KEKKKRKEKKKKKKKKKEKEKKEEKEKENKAKTKHRNKDKNEKKEEQKTQDQDIHNQNQNQSLNPNPSSNPNQNTKSKKKKKKKQSVVKIDSNIVISPVSKSEQRYKKKKKRHSAGKIDELAQGTRTNELDSNIFSNSAEIAFPFQDANNSDGEEGEIRSEQEEEEEEEEEEDDDDDDDDEEDEIDDDRDDEEEEGSTVYPQSTKNVSWVLDVLEPKKQRKSKSHPNEIEGLFVRKLEQETEEEEEEEKNGTNLLDLIPYPDMNAEQYVQEDNIDLEDIQIIREKVGQGKTAVVHKAIYKEQVTVALKEFRFGRLPEQVMKEFHKELQVLKLKSTKKK